MREDRDALRAGEFRYGKLSGKCLPLNSKVAYYSYMVEMMSGFGNVAPFYIGVVAMALTILIGGMAVFTVQHFRRQNHPDEQV